MNDKKPPDLKDRTREYALRVIRLTGSLPSSREGNVIGNQLLRSGTAVGAIYREGTRARSKAEYAAKLNLALMELEESMYWLEIVEGAGLVKRKRLDGIKDETSQLSAILVSLIKNAKGSKL